MRILLAEDEPRLAHTLARGLRRSGWAVDVAPDGGSALEQAAGTAYDVVVLDRDLPVVHGDDVCRQLVADAEGTGPGGGPGGARILMLTAAASIGDRVAGFELGADDYLPKPFAFAELVARLKALERRSGAAGAGRLLTHGDVELDPGRRRVRRAGRDITLTGKELAVLQVLIEADGAVVSAEELVRRAWDARTDPATNSVRMAVMGLRRKLGEPTVVQTVVGAGYRLA